jgi:NAD(P)-dependent dehydrogenase (short-subunit alcohol dehydrogenase family)
LISGKITLGNKEGNMEYDFNLKGKVAVLTGAAGILCSEIAMGLAKKGVKVALLDLADMKAKEIADRIAADGGEAFSEKVDVLDKKSIESAADKILKKFGTVDILINGAGGNKEEATTGKNKSFFDIPEEAIKWVFDLNLIGTILPCQVFGKIFAEKGKGSIINISSMAAFIPLTRTLAYSAAKAGVSNFTNWLAVHMNQEYSPEIRVNAIAPGFLLTDQNYYLLIDKKTGGFTERGKKIINKTPMGRYGKPEELLGAIIFLCSDEASFVNGVILPVDGGFAAYSGV